MTAHQLELGIYSQGDDPKYSLHLRYSATAADAVINVDAKDVQIDTESLLAAESDPKVYGQILSDSLFSPPKIKETYVEARRAARRNGVPLRVQIRLGTGTSELYPIRWETLLDPKDGTRMATNQNIYFARLMNEAEWAQVKLPRKSSIRALIVVSNPHDLEQKSKLPSIDTAREVSRARSALGNIPSNCIGVDEFATPSAIFAALRDGYDVLYLVCHGAFLNDRPRLWLQDDSGNTKVVSGSDFIEQCKELRNTPRLAVLASCESSSGGDSRSDSGPAYLAPRLAEAGIPAIIGMQGRIRTESASKFVSTFFDELQRTGFVDQAVSEARQSIREELDWWSPSLVMRRTSGRIWSLPGWTSRIANSESEGDQGIWDALIRNIVDENCTPIIGPDVISGFVGSRRDVARSWAEQYRFPMAKKDKETLPQVAQFLAVEKGIHFPAGELIRYVYSQAQRLRRASNEDGTHAPLNLRVTPTELVASKLQELLSEYMRDIRKSDPADPHKVIANLKSKIYITTNYGNTLEEALAENGKEPVVELCRWNRFTSELPTVRERYGNYVPSIEKPLVFKVFGELSQPDSVVLTEDDYFDFLIGSTQFKNQIPSAVSGALCKTALLFIGYELNDWDFRILFRSIISQGGWQANTKSPKHVAATLDPEEGEIIEPEGARKYLDDYFSTAEINIYWGSSDEFLRALHSQMSD